jgi:retron-type reverse transcriptase
MSFVQPGPRGSGRKRGNMPRPEDKSFSISKLMVWEAWRQVKANKGAPGVDGQDLDEFEADLRDNLYKIWNRMSSGSYFPPPVRAVEIPKPHSPGTRVLGVPTVTSYPKAVQCVFGFVGGHASVPSAQR